ncbi:MAG TPA: hypothetical protein VGH22_15485 [Candidatus Binatia bacterium]|jgi:hypothetical protein
MEKSVSEGVDPIAGVRGVIREQNAEIAALKALIRSMGGGARLERLYEEASGACPEETRWNAG